MWARWPSPQQQGQVDAVRQPLAAAQMAANLDPESIDVLALDEGLRGGRGRGRPGRELRSRVDTDERRAARRQAEADKAQSEQAAAMARLPATAPRRSTAWPRPT